MPISAEQRRAALLHFDALSEADATERQRQLDALRRDDPVVAALLTRMLDDDGRGDGLLDGSLRKLAPTVVSDLESAAQPGQDAHSKPPEIPGLRILGPLGSGGMGEVFLAERGNDGLRHRVALKLLRLGLDSHEIRRRFLRERQILASLEHPGIARFVDAGVATDGRPWLAMEYVEGTPVDAYARRQSLDLRARVGLLLQVCRAVAHAQSKLVVHRDIKPSNILIDAAGRPRLLDFGIAKLIEAPEQPAATRTLLRAMSPAYAAPEQWRGEAVTTATDVYALGLVLHELVCGRLPEGDPDGPEGFRSSDVERGPGSLIIADPATASAALGLEHAAALRIGREARGDLERIVRHALRADPCRRYQSAAALGDDLQAWLERRPISARPEHRLYPLQRFASRHRWGVALGSIALSALIASWGIALEQARRATLEAERAEQQALRATEALQRANRGRQFLAGLFDASRPTVQAKGAAMTVVDFIGEAALRLEAELDGLPTEQAEIGVSLSSTLSELGKPAEALPIMDAAIERLRALAPGGSAALANALGRRAINLNQLSRSREAEADALEALDVFSRLPDENALERIRVRTALLVALTQQGRLGDIVEQSEALLRDREELLGADDPALAVDWFNLGTAYVFAERFDSAMEAMRRSDALLTADLSAPAARRAWTLNGLAGAARIIGDLQSAERGFREAREVSRHTLGDDHPMTVNAEFGSVLVAFDRGKDPDELAASARLILSRLDPGYQSRWRLSVDLAQILLAAGRPQEARELLEPVLAHFRANAPDDPVHLRARAYLALALARLGDAAATRAAAELIDETAWPESTPVRIRGEVWVQLTLTQRQLGNAPAADAHAQRARELLTQVFSEHHPRRQMWLQQI